MNAHQYCVIMAGGTVNRFWPISRANMPKQFVDLDVTGGTFVRRTYDRCKGIVPEENIVIVTLSRYADLVREQIPEMPEKNLLLEPYGRKTGPCVAYATYSILKRDPDAVMLIMPSDIFVRYGQVFRNAVSEALDYVAEHPVLMTMGLVPTSPDSNYGYIQVRGGRRASGDSGPLEVKTFMEKPEKDLAQVFCKSGEFYWNSGIFAWKASVVKEEMEHYIPEVTRLFAGWEDVLGTPIENEFIERVYTDCPKVSIDHGIMEKSAKVWMYPAEFGWMDVDNWTSLYEVYPGKDEGGNVTNSLKHNFDSASGNMVFCSDKKKLMAVKGLENFIVIDADDVLLICPKDDTSYRDFVSGRGMAGLDEFK